MNTQFVDQLDNLPKNIILIDRDPDIFSAWNHHFHDIANIETHNRLIHFNNEDTLPPADCIVIPSDSFATFGGGISLTILHFISPSIVWNIRRRIEVEYNGTQPVGTCIIEASKSNKFPYIAHTPTMPYAMDISKTQNAYHAFSAVLSEIKKHNSNNHDITTLLCPGLGSGVGALDAESVAKQMSFAFRTHYTLLGNQPSQSDSTPQPNPTIPFPNLNPATDTINELESVSKFKHEAENQLQVIISKISRLLRNGPNKYPLSFNDDLVTLQNSANILSKLVDDLGYIDKRSGTAVSPKKDFNVLEVLRNVIRQVQNWLDHKHMSIALHGNDSLLNGSQCVCFGNPENLARTFFNVIHNAIKFSPSGSGISIYMNINNHSKKELTLNFIDHGCGIPRNHWHSVFQPNIRLSTHIQGNGLGLSIAKDIIQDFQGEIGIANSEIGQGTVFYIILPIHSKSDSFPSS